MPHTTIAPMPLVHVLLKYLLRNFQTTSRSLSALSRLQNSSGRPFILGLHPVRGWNRREGPCGVEVCRGDVQDKTTQYFKRSSLIERLDEVEKLAYQLNEEAERTERQIRRLSKVMYGSTCADMQVDVMGECLSSIKHVVGTTSGCFYPRSIHWKLEEGRSVTSVAADFGIAHRIVSRLWRQFQTTGTAIRGFSSGRPQGTTPADDRYIVLQARRNRRQTAGEIVRHTTQVTGRKISRFTVARRLHCGGLFARRPVRRVTLTPAHRRRRSLWCREHRNWRDNEWGRVLFTDESRFSLSSDSHRILIWKERGSRNHPSNIIERDRYGGRGVLRRYGSAVPFHGRNAPCHRTVAAERLLESEDIERMDWPARSPDLNPIEHVWDFLGRRLAARTLPPATIRELRLALQDEWAAMPQQLIDTLILSMGRRCETCLAVRGDHIPYYYSLSCWTPITGMFRPSVALRSRLLFQ
ncbi:transposable element Tcb2 transposase [Trichonephila clavipes]|nr:transposable element Tcb2 transposase [Trichonephila clavipes]